MEQSGQQSSNATNPSKLTNTLLNGNNYLSWARLVTFSLSGKEKLEYITGESEKPKPANSDRPTETEKKAASKWQSTDHIVMSWLLGSMEPAISDLFLCHNSSFELWEGVKAMYGNQNNHSHIYRILQEIRQERQGTRGNREYLGSMKKKFDELKLYRPPTIDPVILQKRIEEDEIFHYLDGLDPSYDAVKSQLLLTTELPSFSKIANMIQQEETRRIAMGGSHARDGEEHETQAFAAKNLFSNRTGQNPSSQNQPKARDKCSHCRKEGHTLKKCFFLHPHLRPKWWKEGGEKERKGGYRFGEK